VQLRQKEINQTNGATESCFLSSLTPPPPSYQGSGWLLPVISLLYSVCIAGVSLPIHIIGEVSWEPKRRRAWASYSIWFLFEPKQLSCGVTVITFMSLNNKFLQLYYTSGFWPRVRVRALRAPVFELMATRNRALPPPAHRSVAARQKYKNKSSSPFLSAFPETKCLPSGPKSGQQGDPTELRCTLLS
jgi:hypothetical protein